MASMTKDWFREGEVAFRRGKDLEDCPYDEGTEAHRAWCEGWLIMSEQYDLD